MKTNFLFKAICTLLLSGALLTTIGCPSAGGESEPAVTDCSVHNKDKDKCNKAETTNGKKCKYDDATNTCKEDTLPKEGCAGLSDDACKSHKECTFDPDTAPKCQDAAATIKGKCEAIQTDTVCNADTASSCIWDTVNSKCVEFETTALTYSEITPIAEAGTYADKNVTNIVIAGDNSYVYVVNDAGKKIEIFKNDDVTKLTDGPHWDHATATGAGTDGTGGVSDINLTEAAAAVIYAMPAPTGALFTISPGATNAPSQGIAYFEGVDKKRTYDTDTLASIEANGGGNNGGAGNLSIAVVAKISAGDDAILALNKADGKAGLAKLSVKSKIENGVGATAGTTVAALAFATSGTVHFIAKVGGIIDRITAADTKTAGGSAFIKPGVSDYVHSNGGNKAWSFDAAGPYTANNAEINDLKYVGGNLFIALDGTGPKNGGLVIIQGATDAAGTALQPHASTAGAEVKSLAVRANGDVYGFAVNKIFVFRGANTEPVEVIENASVNANQGKTTDLTAKKGFLGAITPYVQMTHGVWLDADTLLVGDEAEGLFTINFNASKQVKLKK